MQMKCFVACASGHEDVYKIYDGAIRPVLKEMGIRPVLVEREEHNDDINQRIMEAYLYVVGSSRVGVSPHSPSLLFRGSRHHFSDDVGSARR